MSREIRFNAWLPDVGFMLEDVSVGHGSVGCPSDYEEFNSHLKSKGFDADGGELPDWLYDTGEDWYIITGDEHFTLLQFTGLKDKNGKRIYEGDVLQGRNQVYRVIYRDGCFWALSKSDVHWIYHLYDCEDFEVIGSLYQSPSLLNK